MFQYSILDPRNPAKAPEAEMANNKVFTEATVGVYGVEVSVPALAARCTLGNLDPQHSGDMNIAACEAALTCELPPAGATLATVRPDADSVLAMAILTMRAGGRTIVDESKIRLIGDSDSAPNGPWRKGYHPPKEFAQVNMLVMDHRISMLGRVCGLIDWLEGFGRLPDVEPVDDSEFGVESKGRYVVVRANGSAGRGACGVGYQTAPIVVTVNEAFSMRGESPHRKYTIARWNSTHVPMDWAEMLEELNRIEPGWGGAGNSICGSPQGTASGLSLPEVISIVERHLPPAE